MPKPQYVQKFRPSWLKDPEFSRWLTVVDSTQGSKAKCKVCGLIMQNRYATLKTHKESSKHKENENIVFGKAQPRIPFKPVSQLNEQRMAEARLSLYIACHSSFNAVDHLGGICSNSFTGHTAADNLKLHRTKCCYIIKNVLAPYFCNELRNDIGDSPYSLLIDESTDISVNKYLGIIIIYYSKQQNRIIETFLDMPKIVECDAENIVITINDTLNKYNLKHENLRGIGTDNASVMVGINNGVYAKLKEYVPNLVLVRCVCHSLQLAVSEASEKLPRHIDFLVRETYNWFSHSTLRQESYKQVFQTINDGQEPKKIVQASQTRWLSIESAVSRIIEQWLELKTFFEMSRFKERCYTAETLYAMYNDDKNYALMSILRAILVDVQRVNKLFESNTADPTRLYGELHDLLQSFVKKIILPHAKLDIFHGKVEDFIDKNCYLGYQFENTLKRMKEENRLTQEDEMDLRDRVINFILALISQIRKRFPENYNILKNVSLFNVNNVLKHDKLSFLPLLKYFAKSEIDIDDIERQWRNIHLLEWNEKKSTKDFWYEVALFKDANDENPFKKLANFAIEVLILPYSNAEVERLFSKLNLIKSKLRNKLHTDTTKAILYIKCGLSRVKQCCKDYDLPKDVLDKIKTKETYENVDLTPSSDILDLFNEII